MNVARAVAGIGYQIANEATNFICEVGSDSDWDSSSSLYRD